MDTAIIILTTIAAIAGLALVGWSLANKQKQQVENVQIPEGASTSLDAVVVEKKNIKVGSDKEGNPVYAIVRGLNVSDFTVLLNNQEKLMLMVFGNDNGKSFDWKNEQVIGDQLLERAPALAYLAIALATEQEEQAVKISQFPISVQLELFVAVFRLTMPEGVKKTVKKLTQELKHLNKS